MDTNKMFKKRDKKDKKKKDKKSKKEHKEVDHAEDDSEIEDQQLQETVEQEVVEELHEQQSSDDNDEQEVDQKDNVKISKEKTQTIVVTEDKDVAKDVQGDNYFSDMKFADMPLFEQTQKAVAELGFQKCTEIQARAIPHILNGRDVLGSAKTGSGKTLAYMIPAVELLRKANITQKQGMGVLIITPTRELAMHNYKWARDCLQYHNKTHGVVIGGAKRSAEANQLQKGVNLLVATPGRLLDHMENTKGFVFHNLQMLIIDEADAILKIGFEEELNKIIKLLPQKTRVTCLFSATMTKKVEDLCRLSLKNPVLIEVAKESASSTNASLEQGYVIADPGRKFQLLFTFLRKNMTKKIMVFMSSCNAVKFYSDLLNYVDIPVKDIHGKQKQQKRTSTYFEFCQASDGILLCTDVAQRGLDFPKVDWVIQYDPPDDPDDYIHRVGRTGRGSDGGGKALLFLLQHEISFIRFLKQKKVKPNEFEFPVNKLANVQDQFMKLVDKNYYLNTSAKDAYRSYLQSYASHSQRDIFDVNLLDLAAVAKSFGLSAPPRVSLHIKTGGAQARKSKLRDQLGAQGEKNYYKTSMDAKNKDTVKGRQVMY